MSGVAVVVYLLTHNAPLNGVVVTAQIMAGILPLKTPLPAIGVTQVSGVPRLTLAMIEAGALQSDRVQVTVKTRGRASTVAGGGYPEQKSIIVLARAALPNMRGVINGVTVDSILPDVTGPDDQDLQLDEYTQSQDFIVKWR